MWLVNDGCACCQYLINAFSLIRLPIKIINRSELTTRSSENFSILFSCKINPSFITRLETFFPHFFSIVSFTDELPEISTPTTQTEKNIIFLKKNFSEGELKNCIYQAQKIHNQKINTSEGFQNEYPLLHQQIIGQSKQVQNIKKLITQVAKTDSTVLIMGESGTGKEIIASCIHKLSTKKQKAFVPINCGAIPSELIESELFGHEKGAFTGALSKRIGRFEIANKGTLFLDKIGDMPLQMQVKLLRVLQEKSIERIGGSESIPVEVRIISATHKDLKLMLKDNLFREDLFYRINVFPIFVPTLRERREDIALLIEHFTQKISLRLSKNVSFNAKALSTLSTYDWPGNIRELQNFLERIVILYPNHVVGPKEIEQALFSKTSFISSQEIDDEFSNKNKHLFGENTEDYLHKEFSVA